MIIEKLKSKFSGRVLVRGGSLPGDGEKIFIYFLKKKPIKTIVEIGTYNGVSTALLSKFAENVITIDIKDRPIRNEIWNYLKIKNIKSYIVKNNLEKKELLDKLEFDFAFIDGDHNDVNPDLEYCKKCKRILFHDYNNSYPSVDGVVNSLPKEEIEIKGIFAYWSPKK